MAPLRVAQIVGEFEPTRGGVARFVGVLAKKLAEDGHRVDVYAFGPTAPMPEVKIVRLPRSARGIFALWCHLGRGHYDVVHYHSYSSFIPAVSIPGALVSNAVRVFTPQLHSGGHFPRVARLAFDRSVARAVVLCTDLVQVDTPAEAELLRQMFGLKLEKIAILPPPLDPTFEQAALPRERDFTSDPFRILFVGRLDPNKGIEHLIRALSTAEYRTGRALELVIVGSDMAKIRGELERLARRVLRRTQVCFLGEVSDLELLRLYDASHIFVLPSRYEAFGIAILEAMSRGLPVIATRTGGIPHLVEDRKTGLLVPVGDEGALCGAILELVGNLDECRSLGRAGFLRSRDFGVKAIAERQTAIYLKTLGRHVRSAPR